MVKVLLPRMRQWLGLFTMVLVEDSSEKGLFRHLSNHLFRSRQFRKYIGYDGHFFFINVHNFRYISEIPTKIETKILVFEIIVSELVALKCPYYEDNTCHRQSMCKQKVLRFCIDVKENFSSSITFTVTTKYGKDAVVQIARVFERIYHVACQRVN